MIVLIDNKSGGIGVSRYWLIGVVVTSLYAVYDVVSRPGGVDMYT